MKRKARRGFDGGGIEALNQPMSRYIHTPNRSVNAVADPNRPVPGLPFNERKCLSDKILW